MQRFVNMRRQEWWCYEMAQLQYEISMLEETNETVAV